jgi:hypothetical protein
MKLKTISIGLLGLLCLMLPGSVRADTVLTYTGNPYAACQWGYTCTGTSPALSFTLDTTLTEAQFDNLTLGTVAGGNLSGFVSSFTLTDGAEVTVTDLTAAYQFFDVTTGPSGAITSWDILAYTNAAFWGLNNFGATCNSPSVANCTVLDTTDVQYNGCCYLAYGANFNEPGTWTVKTPEPGTGSLIMLGIGIGFVLVTRKRIAQGMAQATWMHRSISVPAQH